MKEDKALKGYDWEAARKDNRQRNARSVKPTPRGSINGNA